MMELLPTGSENKIFEVKTDQVVVVMKSKKSNQQYFKSGETENYDSTIVFTGLDMREIQLKESEDAIPIQKNSSINSVSYHTAPLFFEQSDYEIIIKGIGNKRVGFYHENPLIRKCVDAISLGENLLTGIINFDNNIGQSDLVITIEEAKSHVITIEVFPSKISYKEDYKNIVEDITNEIYSIVFDFLRKTYESFKLGEHVEYTPAVFFTILRTVFQSFINAADQILNRPHHILKKEYVILPAHKVKKIDHKTITWLEKHPEMIKRTENGFAASKSLSVNKHVTYNTLENQFTKHLLLTTKKRLENFQRLYQNQEKSGDPIILEQIEHMKREIGRRVYQSFLNDVDDYKSTNSMSLVFTMAPGYRDLYKYYLMLMKGLAVNGDVFNISVKDTAQLYEYWCFIKLNSLLKKNYQLASPDVIKVDRRGITVSLTKGRPSEVTYINPRNNEKIVLSYNPIEQKTETVNQKPDNVLTLEKTGSDVKYSYVFDAKYRLDTKISNPDYPDAKPGPKLDDINAMHRYRDSIVYKNKNSARLIFEKVMFGAYVLFPYSQEEEYQRHRFYRSIESVNIGGLPFLPGATNLVEKFLTELIMDSQESAFERASLPAGIERKLAKVDWSNMDVLVGSLNNPQQLQINVDQKFYYAPVRVISESAFPIRYVALYQSSKKYKEDAGIHYYGTVTKTSICRRSEIPVPMSKPNENELYYRFDVKSWHKLDVPIKVREEGAYQPKYTNLFLLRNCRDSYELFNIRSEEQFRLLQELKRISSDTSVNDDHFSPVFQISPERTVAMKNGNIMILDKEGIIGPPISVTDFIKRPRYMFNLLKESL